MRYLLDANAVIRLLNNNSRHLARRVRREAPTEVAISVIVAHELFNLARINALRFQVIEFDTEDARQAGEIRAILAAQGMPVGPYDVLIAGQAVARNVVLVTANTGEFSRVPGLRIENWET
jgi:tRNA(fMet)-specific endonuclease VapC